MASLRSVFFWWIRGFHKLLHVSRVGRGGCVAKVGAWPPNMRDVPCVSPNERDAKKNRLKLLQNHQKMLCFNTFMPFPGVSQRDTPFFLCFSSRWTSICWTLWELPIGSSVYVEVKNESIWPFMHENRVVPSIFFAALAFVGDTPRNLKSQAQPLSPARFWARTYQDLLCISSCRSLFPIAVLAWIFVPNVVHIQLKTQFPLWCEPKKRACRFFPLLLQASTGKWAESPSTTQTHLKKKTRDVGKSCEDINDAGRYRENITTFELSFQSAL